LSEAACSRTRTVPGVVSGSVMSVLYSSLSVPPWAEIVSARNENPAGYIEKPWFPEGTKAENTG
jgi:hypothetical protein